MQDLSFKSTYCPLSKLFFLSYNLYSPLSPKLPYNTIETSASVPAFSLLPVKTEILYFLSKHKYYKIVEASIEEYFF